MKLGLILSALLTSMALAFASPASAEIYHCKQADGFSAFSDTPCPAQEVNGTSEVHVLWRQMRSLLNEGAEITTLIGPDFYSILACNEEIDAFNQKLNNAEKTLRMFSPVTHNKMYSALGNLRVCGTCRVSAPIYCQKASTNLLEETKVLASLN